MTVRAGGIWLTVLSHTYVAWIVGAVLQGLGTAIVYPALLACVGDVAHPECGLRLSVSIGSGATWVTLLALCSPAWLRTCWVWRRHAVAVLTLVSGLHVMLQMPETLPTKLRRAVATLSVENGS